MRINVEEDIKQAEESDETDYDDDVVDDDDDDEDDDNEDDDDDDNEDDDDDNDAERRDEDGLDFDPTSDVWNTGKTRTIIVHRREDLIFRVINCAFVVFFVVFLILKSFRSLKCLIELVLFVYMYL